VKRWTRVLLTHDHADQVHGLDDVRAFYLRQQARIPCWMDAATDATRMRRFGYIFEGEGGYPAICDRHLIPAHGEGWQSRGRPGPSPSPPSTRTTAA
jgi:phosphoribosyl 1,2-cyclic phosphate phosphodiesterase